MSPRFDLARIGAGLPFASTLGNLEASLTSGACVVQAPPGSGKTTLAPPCVAHWCGAHELPGRILVTQPRRIATRAAAYRLAELSGYEVGREVGYSVRGESRVSPETVVEFVTPGLRVRRLLADPALEGVAAVILDEVHERSLDSDLLIGMLSDLRIVREDLVLVAMSATLDAPRFAALLGDKSPAPIVECASEIYPLEIHWEPHPKRTDARGVTREFWRHVADRTCAALVTADDSPEQSLHGSDALVFLPSVRDVEGVAELLRSSQHRLDVLTLHGQLSASEQDVVTRGSGPNDARRIIVSTALAESSLTVPGVRIVIDSGLSREPRRDTARGMNGLVTVACSRASAQQRAGRAARLGPGLVVRCYDEQTFARMPENLTPEIATADLTAATLTLAAWGTPGGQSLPLPTLPPPAALEAATTALRELGAVDEDGAITSAGQVLARIPTDPRLGRALLDGAKIVGAEDASRIVAALSSDMRPRSCDIRQALQELRGPARERWRREAHRLRRIAEQNASSDAEKPSSALVPVEPADIAGVITGLAFPDRIAKRIKGNVYLLASGTRAALPAHAALEGQDWLAVAEVARAEGAAAQGTGAVIRLAAPLSRSTAEAIAGPLLVEDVRASWGSDGVAARRVRALGAIELSATPVSPTPESGRVAVVEAIATSGLSLLPWSEAANSLRQRLAFLHHQLGMPWPDVSDDRLIEHLNDWLAPEIAELASGKPASKIDCAEALRRLLPWPEASRFDQLAPERLLVPSGSRIRLHYPAIDEPGAAPVAAVKLQECFGLTQSPTVADGRSRIVFHLLSPAGHPLAVTDDLASFWAGPYAQVRTEMRGRYPKHPWPEDPATHVATARTKKRM